MKRLARSRRHGRETGDRLTFGSRSAVGLLVLLALLTTACAQAGAPDGADSEPPPPENAKVYLVFRGLMLYVPVVDDVGETVSMLVQMVDDGADSHEQTIHVQQGGTLQWSARPHDDLVDASSNPERTQQAIALGRVRLDPGWHDGGPVSDFEVYRASDCTGPYPNDSRDADQARAGCWLLPVGLPNAKTDAAYARAYPAVVPGPATDGQVVLEHGRFMTYNFAGDTSAGSLREKLLDLCTAYEDASESCTQYSSDDENPAPRIMASEMILELEARPTGSGAPSFHLGVQSFSGQSGRLDLVADGNAPVVIHVDNLPRDRSGGYRPSAPHFRHFYEAIDSPRQGDPYPGLAASAPTDLQRPDWQLLPPPLTHPDNLPICPGGCAPPYCG